MEAALKRQLLGGRLSNDGEGGGGGGGGAGEGRLGRGLSAALKPEEVEQVRRLRVSALKCDLCFRFDLLLSPRHHRSFLLLTALLNMIPCSQIRKEAAEQAAAQATQLEAERQKASAEAANYERKQKQLEVRAAELGALL
jgi:hypothetical protein